jgi:hypothetical protein
MRDRIQKPGRGSRRLVSALAFGVAGLAAWVLATNTIFRPADTTDSRAVAPEAVVEAKPQSMLSIIRKADERVAPAPGSVTAVGETSAPAPSSVAAVEGKPAPTPAPTEVASAGEMSLPAPTPPEEGVEVAAVSPTMGGSETLLSPTLVSRSVEPSRRPRVAAIPLPRPRPMIQAPVAAGREITDADIMKPQVY